MIRIPGLQSLLGINQRNLDYISAFNPRSAFPLVDDKIRTKEILTAAGVPVPRSLMVVDSFFEIENVLRFLQSLRTFVIKPARGRAGGGVLLAEKRPEGGWRTPTGRKLAEDDLNRQFGDILFGVYSFGRMGDRALVEDRVTPARFLTEIYRKGIPDIRIITFRRKPVMAMLRMPADRSDGKANLHQGALGIGISLESGTTGSAVYGHSRLDRHPDSGVPLAGLTIPFWPEILGIAVKSSEAVPLEYLGIDIVIDEVKGPLVLELNARPGLQIQVVNSAGLVPLLEEADE